MTGAPVAMRAAPAGNAQIVQRIPANAEIELSRLLARLVPGLLAEPVRLCSCGRGRSGPAAGDVAGDEMPPPVVNRAADLCRAAGLGDGPAPMSGAASASAPARW